jgi:hypothetical protein
MNCKTILYAMAVATLVATACTSGPNSLSRNERREGYELLFNGHDLSGWQGATEGYYVADGAICSREGFNNLYTQREYSDFVLRFEFSFSEVGVNSGIGIRTPMGVDAAYYGMCEVQILDHDAPIYAGLRDYQVHGSVYGIAPAERIVHKPLGEWSQQEIRVVGDRVTVSVDGRVIVDCDVREACDGQNVGTTGDFRNPATYDGYDHPGLFNTAGYVGLLVHGAGARFRNLRILDLGR